MKNPQSLSAENKIILVEYLLFKIVGHDEQ